MSTSGHIQLLVRQLNGTCRILGQGFLLLLTEVDPKERILPCLDNLVTEHYITS
jgi:hypothetical protein